MVNVASLARSSPRCRRVRTLVSCGTIWHGWPPVVISSNINAAASSRTVRDEGLRRRSLSSRQPGGAWVVSRHPWRVMRTTTMTEVIELISAEASQLQGFLAGLGTAEWSMPSACAGWTVGDVVAHLTQGARTWGEGIARARAGDSNPPQGQPPLRPGERGSAATAQRAIDFRQE